MLAERGSCRDATYEHKVYPLRKSQYTNRKHKVDLLLFSDKPAERPGCEDDSETQHYCVIKNMSRLISSQVSEDGHVLYFCRNCYASYTSEKSLAKHEELCQMHGTVKIEMPKITEKHGLPTQSFTNHYRSQSVPFVVYADLESFTKTIHTCQPVERPEPNPKDSYTKKYQKHEPSGFCYYIKCFDGSVYSQDPVIFTKESPNDDVSQIFVESLEKKTSRISITCLGFQKV